MSSIEEHTAYSKTAALKSVGIRSNILKELEKATTRSVFKARIDHTDRKKKIHATSPIVVVHPAYIFPITHALPV